MKVFGLPPRGCPELYVLEPYLWIGGEPSRLLLEPSLSVFAYSFGLVL